MQRWCAFFSFFFYSPSALPSPNTLRTRLSLTLSPYTSWFFHLPHLPIPAHIFFCVGVGRGVGSLALFEKRFFSRQVVAPFLTFIRLYAESVSTLCSSWTHAHAGHLHMGAKTIEKPPSPVAYFCLSFFLFFFFGATAFKHLKGKGKPLVTSSLLKAVARCGTEG